ncbi:uncharacterized protein LOC131233773 [Magnolia sinica]|uniref:uncharacterized protein LOC131233773 n=1 Tax=Magnolia sinica TaxID=86752 RepID=UPI0026592E32|nr:uncharacterized protein LOC131233773 [Magnolia sinica]
MESLLTMASSVVFPKILLSSVSDRYKLLQIIRYAIALALSFIFFFLRILLRFPPLLGQSFTVHLRKPESQDSISAIVADSGIARALSQMLSIMNAVHVSSRKYELVRSLAERVIEDNAREGSPEVNREVLSAAFSSTMGKLEGAMSARAVVGSGQFFVLGDGKLNQLLGAVRRLWAAAGSAPGDGLKDGDGADGSSSAEKLAAELLWLAWKMAECGAAEEAVSRWGSASGLASMAVYAEPRLQGSLVKVSAFLFKQAKELEEDEGKKYEESGGAVGQDRRMNMLMSWLPFLCHASNGTDTPVLSRAERTEMETVLEETIEELNNYGQEKVLALWLHHFTACPNSDWPNLQACYARWYTASRRLLLLN